MQKSALESNSLTDRSIAIWKRLDDWTDPVAREKIVTENLRLVFNVSNPVSPGAWAHLFDRARNDAEAGAAMIQVREALWGTAPTFATDYLSLYRARG